MIWTITPNPALDVTYQVPDLELGKVSPAATPTRLPGGKGLNVARTLAQLGVRNTATGLLGGPTGAEFMKLLQELPHTNLITSAFVDAGVNTRSSIALVKNGNATVVNETGHAVPTEVWAVVNAQLERVQPGDVVALCGSFPPETDPQVATDLVQKCKQKGAIVLADTSGPYLLAAAAGGADVLKPNHLELAAATGTTDVAQGAHALQAAGGGIVVCSAAEGGMNAFLGKHAGHKIAQSENAGGDTANDSNGDGHSVSHVRSHPHDEDEPLFTPPARLVSGNPTGAGDSVVAALAYRISTCGLSGDWAEYLAFASILAAATVAHPTAGGFDEKLYNQLKVEKHVS
ncbi:MAG: PfkB family carbohydrate kinase [Actinomycetaceae bacterium]|nr:PfkB family carbohydrate kinase [Actinomycetaceae bacterium]